MSARKGFGEQAAWCASGSAWTLQGNGLGLADAGFFGSGLCMSWTSRTPDRCCASRSGAAVEAQILECGIAGDRIAGHQRILG
jgi:hypothetical protein